MKETKGSINWDTSGIVTKCNSYLEMATCMLYLLSTYMYGLLTSPPGGGGLPYGTDGDARRKF